jgi:ATP diphosphatase
MEKSKSDEVYKRNIGIQRLLSLVKRLRDPENGCPWDIEQNSRSIAHYCIEEAHELQHAISLDKKDAIKSELGDLLFQIVFHCDIAEKQYGFSFDDVIQDICDKMIFRHPHVFNGKDGEGQSISSKEVKDNWEKIKSLEKNSAQDSERFFEDVPLSLPALSHATKVQKKASQLNFDFKDSWEMLGKINEESKELWHAYEANEKLSVEEEFGDLLFSIVNLGRKLDLDPEKSLGVSIKKFKKRISESIKLIEAKKISDKHLTDKKLHEIWEQAKDLLNKNDN